MGDLNGDVIIKESTEEDVSKVGGSIGAEFIKVMIDVFFTLN